MVHVKEVSTHRAVADQKKFESQREFIKNLLIMVIILLVGVLVWLVIDIFVLDKTSTVPVSVRHSARRISPLLESEVLTVINANTGFGVSELAYFPVFLDDSSNNRGYTEGLVLRQKDSARPSNTVADELVELLLEELPTATESAQAQP